MADYPLATYSDFEVVDREYADRVRDPSPGSRFIVYVVLALVVSFAAWASLFHIDQSTRAEGQVITSLRIQEIQAAQTGVLKQLLVREGDAVNAGQLLATIDSNRQQAAVNDGRMRLATLNLTIARLRAELAGRPLVFDAAMAREYPAIAAAQRDLYARRIDGLEDETRTMREALALAEQEYQMNLTLFKSGDISQADVLRLKRQTLDLRGQILNRRNRFLQEAQTELAKFESDLAAQVEVVNDRDAVLAHSEIRSPVDGLVNTIRTYTQGGVVREGEEVMQILPSESELIVETKLKPSDVAMVKTGMPAMVKLDAFDYTVFGTLHGTVRSVSPDAITVHTARGDSPYFRVQVAVSKDQMTGRAREIVLRPGMGATVDIRSGRRTVLQYLTKPISRMMNESLTEK